MDKKDELIWDHAPTSAYSPNLGYIELNMEAHNINLSNWWKQLWKLKCSNTYQIFMWCILENKAPSWD